MITRRDFFGAAAGTLVAGTQVKADELKKTFVATPPGRYLWIYPTFSDKAGSIGLLIPSAFLQNESEMVAIPTNLTFHVGVQRFNFPVEIRKTVHLDGQALLLVGMGTLATGTIPQSGFLQIQFFQSQFHSSLPMKFLPGIIMILGNQPSLSGLLTNRLR